MPCAGSLRADSRSVHVHPRPPAPALVATTLGSASRCAPRSLPNTPPRSQIPPRVCASALKELDEDAADWLAANKRTWQGWDATQSSSAVDVDAVPCGDYDTSFGDVRFLRRGLWCVPARFVALLVLPGAFPGAAYARAPSRTAPWANALDALARTRSRVWRSRFFSSRWCCGC